MNFASKKPGEWAKEIASEGADSADLEKRAEKVFGVNPVMVSKDKLISLKEELLGQAGLGQDDYWGKLRQLLVDGELHKVFNENFMGLENFDFDGEDWYGNELYTDVRKQILDDFVATIPKGVKYDQQQAYIKAVVQGFVDAFRVGWTEKVVKEDIPDRMKKIEENVGTFGEWLEGTGETFEPEPEPEPVFEGDVTPPAIQAQRGKVLSIGRRLKHQKDLKKEAMFEGEAKKGYGGDVENGFRTFVRGAIEENLSGNKEVQDLLAQIGWQEGSKYEAVKRTVEEWVVALVKREKHGMTLVRLKFDEEKRKQFSQDVSAMVDRSLQPKLKQFTDFLNGLTKDYNSSFEDLVEQFSKVTGLNFMSGGALDGAALAPFLFNNEDSIKAKLDLFKQYKVEEKTLDQMELEAYLKASRENFIPEVLLERKALTPFSVFMGKDDDLKLLILPRLPAGLDKAKKGELADCLVAKIQGEMNQKNIELTADDGARIEVKEDGTVEVKKQSELESAEADANKPSEEEEGMIAKLEDALDWLPEGLRDILLKIFSFIIDNMSKLQEKIDNLDKDKAAERFNEKYSGLTAELVEAHIDIHLPEGFTKNKDNQKALKQIFKLKESGFATSWDLFVEQRLSQDEIDAIRLKIDEQKLKGSDLLNAFKSLNKDSKEDEPKEDKADDAAAKGDAEKPKDDTPEE